MELLTIFANINFLFYQSLAVVNGGIHQTRQGPHASYNGTNIGNEVKEGGAFFHNVDLHDISGPDVNPAVCG